MKLTKYIARLLTATAITLSSPAPVMAAAPASIEELYQLIQRQDQQLSKQQQQIEILRELVRQQQKQLEKGFARIDKTTRKLKKNSSSDIKIAVKNGLKISSKEKDFAIKIGGRIHFDAAFFDEKETSIGDGADLRRTRLYVSGKLFRDWRFRTEIDFSESGKTGPRDAWLSYSGLDHFTFKAGQFQEPFSLEGMTSSNYITFMERALPFVFIPDYHLGGSISSFGDSWSGSVGVFGEPIHNKKDKIDDGWGIAGRFTYALLHQQRQTIHLGFSSEYREPDGDRQIRYRIRPESYVTNRRLVDTRTIDNVENSLLLAGEFAGVYGPLSLQGEYIHSLVSRNTAETLNFNGWYVYTSWFVTGESRPYKVKKGSFRGIKPIHRYGAWELGFRYSSVDLTDQDITGGREDNITLGLNWYPNRNFRFMANYIFIHAHPNRNGNTEKPQIFQLRGQLNF